VIQVIAYKRQLLKRSSTHVRKWNNAWRGGNWPAFCGRARCARLLYTPIILR